MKAEKFRPKVIYPLRTENKILIPASKMVHERIEIPIPILINLTSTGNTIVLNYHVRIFPVVDGCCECPSDLMMNKLLIPIKIYPSIQTMGTIQMPPIFHAD